MFCCYQKKFFLVKRFSLNKILFCQNKDFSLLEIRKNFGFLVYKITFSLHLKKSNPISRPFLSFDPFFFFVDCLFFVRVLFTLTPLFFRKNTSYSFIKATNKSVFNLFPRLLFFVIGIWGGFFPLFILLCLINLIRLWSYVFTPTAHLFFTFTIGMLIWMSTIMIQLNLFLKRKLEHLAPQGTPTWLLFLIILIELIRQLIRPITLRVRLAANLTAGHLILSLLASLSITTRGFLQIPLLILEILVALVQPFVFCMLLFLYFSEN